MSKKVLAHYMPWFTTIPFWHHWRGEGNPGQFNPEQADDRGRRRIASHYNPLCGPYDSSSSEVIDRHLRLMKDAGIDGIIVDWYGLGLSSDGTTSHANYFALHNATMSIWNTLKDHSTGLELALMFDSHALATVQKDKGEPEEYATRSLQFAATNMFSHAKYLKHQMNDDGGRPILLVFGWPMGEPVTLVQNWEVVLGRVDPRPWILCQVNWDVDGADGVFFWPNPDTVNGNPGEVPCRVALERFAEFENAPRNENQIVMGAAFPGYDDIYKCDNQGGKHKNTIHRQDGETYRKTFKWSYESSKTQFVQIVTWNDWGEGTQIEPSVEFGDREIVATRAILKEARSGSANQ